MTATIPRGSLVLLIGPTGSGKTSWVERHIADRQLPASAVVSTDAIRTQLFDHPQAPVDRDLVNGIVRQTVTARLAHGNTTVVDATNLLPDPRKQLLNHARALGAPTVAVRFDTDLTTLQRRNERRPTPRSERTLVKQRRQMDQVTAAQLDRTAGRVLEHTDPVTFEAYGRHVRPFDATGTVAVFGDVHGCAEQFRVLARTVADRYPDATLISVGDLGDRGPATPEAYRVAAEYGMLLVSSNHGAALADKAGQLLDRGYTATEVAAELDQRASAARTPQVMTELVAGTVAQFAALLDGDEQLARAVDAERNAPFQALATDRSLLVVHGGVTPQLIGQPTNEARTVALFGTPSAKDPDSGRPLDVDGWVGDYNAHPDAAGLPLVVYGHIAYDRPRVEARTVGVDTGAGKLDTGTVTAAIVTDGELTETLSV